MQLWMLQLLQKFPQEAGTTAEDSVSENTKEETEE